MGTKTLGSTTADTTHSATWAFSGGQNIAGNGTLTMPEDGYIDTITVYFGGSGGNVSTYSNLLSSDLASVLASIGPNTFASIGWKTAGFAVGSNYFMPAGTVFHASIACASGVTAAFKSSGSNFAKTGVSTPQPMNSGTTTNQFTSGDLNWYVTYFPKATISSIPSTPVAVGQQFTVKGKSFSAGVTGVTVNGTACPTFTVVDDTTLTVTLASGATSGPVVVTTNAGTATSAQSLQVGSIYIDDSHTWQSGLIIFADDGTNWQQLTIFADNGTSWIQIG